MDKEPFQLISEAILEKTSDDDRKKRIEELSLRYPYFHSLAFFHIPSEDVYKDFHCNLINPIWGTQYRDFLYTNHEHVAPKTNKKNNDSHEEKSARADSKVSSNPNGKTTEVTPTKRRPKSANTSSKPKVTTSRTSTSPRRRKVDSSLFKGKLYTFTTWLAKTESPAIKKKMSLALDIKRVEKSAKTSTRPSEVITESMAKVWLRQNEPKKAIRIYKKMSLLFTEKSAYFAEQIDAVKKQYNL